MGDRAGAKLLRQMPLSEMFWLCYDINTLSSGRATSTMEFHITRKLLHISEAVIKKSKRKRLIFKKMSQKIRIKLKSTIHVLVDKSAEKIVKR
jgi:translation elongation factor EF-G